MMENQFCSNLPAFDPANILLDFYNVILLVNKYLYFLLVFKVWLIQLKKMFYINMLKKAEFNLIINFCPHNLSKEIMNNNSITMLKKSF